MWRDPLRGAASRRIRPAVLSGFDLVVDGSDNFDTRYLAADAAEARKSPLVTAPSAASMARSLC
jgi:molybdopterin/thiamine biosynthesis adenylyltransferase